MLIEVTRIDQLTCLVNGLEVDHRRIDAIGTQIAAQGVVKFNMLKGVGNGRLQTAHIARPLEVGQQLLGRGHQSPVGILVTADVTRRLLVLQLGPVG